MWLNYPYKASGTKIEGDTSSAPTRWWNHLYLALWGWKTVTVFEVSDEDARRGYRVGYAPLVGNAMIESTLRHDRRFRMKIGHESCVFFARCLGDRDVMLFTIARTTVNDPQYQDAPLH